jgi:DNA repair ATPase RecN
VPGDNIYVAWWTNNTENGNEEVMFRASNDAGQTFGPVLRLATNGTISSTNDETTTAAGEEGESE